MKARFQPDAEDKGPPSSMLIDPEAYDASEQQFAASLNAPASRSIVGAARFRRDRADGRIE